MERTDHQLLVDFLRDRESGAFQELVERRGPAVLGVCRRMIGDGHAAEDAFQATFLVLVRKAEFVVKTADGANDLVGWLHRVAVNASLAIRRDSAARRQRELEAAMIREVRDNPKLNDEVWPLLDEEINRLPDRHRMPLLACLVQGQTQEQAAESLGMTYATLRRRLESAKELLRNRLARRGVIVGAGALSLLGAGSATAAVPAFLVASTVSAAGPLLVAQGQAAGGASMAVVTAVKGVLKAMVMMKLKTAAAVAIVAAATAGTGVGAYKALVQTANAPVATPQPAPTLQPATATKPATRLSPIGWSMQNPDGVYRTYRHEFAAGEARAVYSTMVDGTTNFQVAFRNVLYGLTDEEVQLDRRVTFLFGALGARARAAGITREQERQLLRLKRIDYVGAFEKHRAALMAAFRTWYDLPDGPEKDAAKAAVFHAVRAAGKDVADHMPEMKAARFDEIRRILSARQIEELLKDPPSTRPVTQPASRPAPATRPDVESSVIEEIHINAGNLAAWIIVGSDGKSRFCSLINRYTPPTNRGEVEWDFLVRLTHFDTDGQIAARCGLSEDQVKKIKALPNPVVHYLEGDRNITAGIEKLYREYEAAAEPAREAALRPLMNAIRAEGVRRTEKMLADRKARTDGIRQIVTEEQYEKMQKAVKDVVGGGRPTPKQPEPLPDREPGDL